MSLSCSCDFGGECDWYFDTPSDYSTLNTKRGRKCCSCGDKIKPGETVVRFNRTRPPRSEYEERRFGDDWDAIPLASWYQCERCADLFFSFAELGFECVSPAEDMRELAKEYAAVYGPKRAQG